MGLLSQLSPQANNPAPISQVTYPIALITLNGQNLPGLLGCEVTNVTHSSADTFRAKFATSGNNTLNNISKLLGIPQGLPPQFNAAYFSSSINDQIGISFGQAGPKYSISSQLTGIGMQTLPFIFGYVDDVLYDPIERTLELSGRDISGRFMDTLTEIDPESKQYKNYTSSQIVTRFCNDQGIACNVTATTEKIGRYYLYDHVKMAERSQWDFMNYLANYEGFDLYVTTVDVGNGVQPALYFGPFPANTAPFKINWDDSGNTPVSNVTNLRLGRNETLARDVEVHINTWNQVNEKAFTVSARGAKTANQVAILKGKPQIYSFTIPNLTRAQASQIAEQKCKEISAHEKVVEFTMPGDNSLNIHTQVDLTGTGTDWDSQPYFIDNITRHFSWDEGYYMTARSKNHSTMNVNIV